MQTRTSRVIAVVRLSLLFATVSSGLWLERAVATSSGSPGAADFFVSPHGRDTWSGKLADPNDKDGPFATVKRAQEAVRALLKTLPEPRPVRVVLRAGTYYLKQTLEFGPEDSGTQGAPVVYAAAPGEKVVISGGYRLEGGRWAEVNGQKAWVVDIPDVKEGRWNFRQLFVNGERRPRTRRPREGFYAIKAVPERDASHGGDDVNGDRAFIYAGTDIQAWHNLQDVEVVAVATCGSNRLPIQSVDAERHLVTFDRISRGPLMYGGHPIYWVENVFEALDTPGQWYLSRRQGRLYCLPKPGEDLAKVDIIAPLLPQLVRVEGTRDAPVKHLHFQGLTFAHTEWLEPPDWPKEGRYTGAWYDIPGVIRLTHARECVVTQCVIEHGAAYGIEVREGCRDVEISRNRMVDLGAGGVKIWFGSARTTVADNEIGHTGMIFLTSYGILVADSPGSQILYNHIFERHYTGILIGWAMYFEESNAYGNVVEHNHIHDIGLGPVGDMGGIYTEGICTGTRIRYNVVHDIRSRMYGGWGIYHDSGADILDEKNLLYRCDPLCVQNTRNITLENNILALGAGDQVGPIGVFHAPLREYSFQRNIVYYPRGQAVARWDSRSRNCFFDRNLYWTPSGEPVRFGGQSWARWQAAGKDHNGLIADPLFVDPEHGDFTLRPGSPAAQIGFEPWDLSAVGPRPSSVPKAAD